MHLRLVWFSAGKTFRKNLHRIRIEQLNHLGKVNRLHQIVNTLVDIIVGEHQQGIGNIWRLSQAQY